LAFRNVLLNAWFFIPCFKKQQNIFRLSLRNIYIHFTYCSEMNFASIRLMMIASEH